MGIKLSSSILLANVRMWQGEQERTVPKIVNVFTELTTPSPEEGFC